MGTRKAADRRTPATFSCHARDRSAQRNVAPDAVAYVMAHGRVLHRTGAQFFFLGRRDIPRADRGANWAARLEGTIVIASLDGIVITVYRDRHGLRPIERKMKYRLHERARRRARGDGHSPSMRPVGGDRMKCLSAGSR
jgi:hypothetical protein